MLTGIGLACLVATLVLAPLLDRRRRAAQRRRTSAEFRVALLETARTLSGHELPEAARLACEGLRTLGFDAAAVSVRRGRVMVPMHSVGLPSLKRPIPAEGSFAGRCLEEDRTLVVADYASLPTRRPERADLRSVVLTPVRADGRPVATLNAARRRVAEPTPQEIAIVETVAAHLGRVFATQARLAAREELLARMQRLDEMRATFVEQVSDELQGRLEVLRDLSASLEADLDHHDGPVEVLAGIVGHSADLGATIDAMLDFSRFNADRPDPVPVPVTVGELLAPLRPAPGAAPPRPPPATEQYVHVDPELVHHALELLLDPAAADLMPRVDEERDRVLLRFEEAVLDERWRRGGLVPSLVAQLLLAAGAGLLDDGVVTVVLPRWSGA